MLVLRSQGPSRVGKHFFDCPFLQRAIFSNPKGLGPVVKLRCGGKVGNYLKRAIFSGKRALFSGKRALFSSKGALFSSKRALISIKRALFQAKRHFYLSKGQFFETKGTFIK